MEEKPKSGQPAKRKPPAAGIGRKKGVPNKTTAQLKDMILQALDQAGGVHYLVEQAKKNPKAFLPLLGRVLPLQVTGEGGGPIIGEFRLVPLTAVVEASQEADG